jgi:hypothetical protein
LTDEPAAKKRLQLKAAFCNRRQAWCFEKDRFNILTASCAKAAWHFEKV